MPACRPHLTKLLLPAVLAATCLAGCSATTPAELRAEPPFRSLAVNHSYDEAARCMAEELKHPVSGWSSDVDLALDSAQEQAEISVFRDARFSREHELMQLVSLRPGDGGVTTVELRDGLPYTIDKFYLEDTAVIAVICGNGKA